MNLLFGLPERAMVVLEVVHSHLTLKEQEASVHHRGASSLSQ
jgi:hypothetical protein